MKTYLKKLLFLLILTFTFCAASQLHAQAAPKKISFTNTKKVTLFVSEKKVLKVKVAKQYENKKIKFYSSNKKIAKVNKKGIVTALKKGKVTISAKIKGTKKKAKTKVKVLQNVQNIQIVHTSATYYIGKEYHLGAETVPQITDEKIKWKSSDPSIAKIDKTGKLKIKSQGTAIITAYSNKTNKTAELTVQTEYVPEIKIREGKTIFVEYGESIQLHLDFINHPQVKMTFSTPDDLITITPSGYVKTTRPGTAHIIATSADKKYQVSAVLYIKAEKGFVSSAMLGNLNIDDCTKLMIVAHPDDETLWGGAHLMDGNWFVVCMTNQYFPTRKNEYRNVLNTLGIKGIILDYPDLYKNLEGKWKIDSWKYVQDALASDINTIINYKNWEQIVSHSPTGETGHFHHKYVNKAVVSSCTNNAGKFDKLWYFGKFYKKGTIPSSLPQITPEQLAYKEELLKLYVREQGSIKAYWEQMNPYENWEKATAYK